MSAVNSNQNLVPRNIFDLPRTFLNLWSYRQLTWRLVKREVTDRYQGSFLGVLWSFITPLVMLLVYTIVFSGVFGSRFGNRANMGKTDFALMLFCGLMLFNVFTECLNLAPRLVLNKPNFVKKVVFPLEILPLAILGSSLIHAGVSLLILLLGIGAFMHQFPLTIVFYPFVVLPLIMLTLGLSWIIASLGVFIRDIAQGILISTQLLFFLTPIFYDVSAFPARLQWMLKINPLTTIVANARTILIDQHQPNWKALALVTLLALAVMQIGYVWFVRSKRWFADVM